MTNLHTITVREAMTLTGFPRSAVYRLVHSGAWPSVRVGPNTSHFRIFEDSITAWFEKQQQQAAPTSHAIDADAALPEVKEPAFS